jgi:hypothetical protein
MRRILSGCLLAILPMLLVLRGPEAAAAVLHGAMVVTKVVQVTGAVPDLRPLARR